jgi:hypothetical protein
MSDALRSGQRDYLVQMNSSDHEAVVRRFVDLLCDAVGRKVGSDSPAAGNFIPVLGGVLPRGAVISSSPSGVPVMPPAASRDKLRAVISQWRQQSSEVRQEVIQALGERGDVFAVRVLTALAGWEPLRPLRIRVAAALAQARAEEAVAALMIMARADAAEEVRAEAIRLLGVCALKAWPALGVRSRSVPRLAGAVRTRGVMRSKSSPLSPQAEHILEMMDKVRFQDPSPTVRSTADATLGNLDD